ncbi:MAG: penicillin-binding transpeptidase domain-containing protein [Ferruginibacter sp.]
MKSTTPFLLLLATIFLIEACSVHKANVDDSLERFFKEASVTGTFTMLNNATGEITVYNMAQDTIRQNPGSTLDVLTALIALQNGLVPDTKTGLTVDSLASTTASKSVNIREALPNHVSNYFREIINRMGQPVFKKWIDTIHYGNQLIGSNSPSAGIESLRISPDEQLGLMKRLYFNQLPFRKSVQDTVKQLMLREDNTLYRLSYAYSPSASMSATGNQWLIGWIEENGHVYFFVTHTRTAQPVSKTEVPLNITRKILKSYGFFEGKK